MKAPVANGVFFVLSLLLFLYVCGISVKNIFRYNTFKMEHRELSAVVNKERRTHERLQIQILRLGTSDFWEIEARQRLGMTRPGEKIYQFVEP